MKNLNGNPVWYELMTKDPLGARRFYSEIVGWEIDELPPAESSLDYRMISAGDGLVGGMLTLTDEMCQQGAAPSWLMYLGVDDVDACVESIVAGGGRVLRPAYDIPDVGRIAMLSDPQGAPFYVIRGASDGKSTACAPDRARHGAWHELHALDGPQAVQFYTQQFEWRKGLGMDMGGMGIYQLFTVGDVDLGGIMTDKRFSRPAWLVYFRVDGIERAASRIVVAGGQVVHGPMEVPGGGWIVNGLDPDGAMFALTGTR